VKLAPASATATTGNGSGGNGASGSARTSLKVSDSGPLALYVFKTISDPFAGHISFFKVFSGVVKNDAAVQNFTRNVAEKFAHLSIMEGRAAVPVSELHAGDIGAVAKL
jgi:elongation factor G